MVTINGMQEQAAGMSILSYLNSAGYSPQTVVVEINLEIIPATLWTASSSRTATAWRSSAS